MEAAFDLESSAFGLGGSTPLAPTKDVPAWRNGKTRCIQNAVSSDVGVRCPRPAPMYVNTESWPSGRRRRTANAEHLMRCHSFESNTLRQVLIRGDVCERLKQLTRKVRGPVKIRVQRFESSHHRQLVWKRWACGEPTPFEAGHPSGCERSTRSASARFGEMAESGLWHSP